MSPTPQPSLHPVALIILDGWGIAPPGPGNAVTRARTPVVDRLRAEGPSGLLRTSGRDVGLPEGQMGNSEVGHLNLGAGFVVRQELTRIDETIAEGRLSDNEALRALAKRVMQRGGVLHLVGLLGDGGVHSHDRHLLAIVRVLDELGVTRVAIHALTDGRDTAPDSAAGFLATLEDELQSIGLGRVASIGGRYFTMDRDQRWGRIERGWRAIVDGSGPCAADAHSALAQAADQGISDEFVPPTVISRDADPVGMAAEDGVLLFNFRADRMRQLLTTLTDPAFDGFERPGMPEGGYDVVTLTRYRVGQTAPSAFAPIEVQEPLAHVVSEAGLGQFHAAETEKYAHVTYFINGGREAPFPCEDRRMVPSPDVATYDQAPAMSASALTDVVTARLRERRDALLIVNYANPDMVGHTGDIPATIRAVEAVDTCLGRLLAVLSEVGGTALVTADHGNAEQMIDPETGGAHTAHTTNPVPIAIAGSLPRTRAASSSALREGRLADVAPTVLDLLGIAAPASMTGRSLLPNGSPRPLRTPTVQDD